MSNAAPTQRRHRLVIEPMTAESFAPFGRVLESSEEPVERRVMTPLPFDCDGRTTVHAIWQPCTGRSFSRLERHFGVTQTFVQVAGSPSVVCAAPPTDLDDEGAVPRPADVRAFLIDPGRPFAFARGTWHSLDRYVLSPPRSDVRHPQRRPEPDPDRRLRGRNVDPVRGSRRRRGAGRNRRRHRAAPRVRVLAKRRFGPTSRSRERGHLVRGKLHKPHDLTTFFSACPARIPDFLLAFPAVTNGLRSGLPRPRRRADPHVARGHGGGARACGQEQGRGRLRAERSLREVARTDAV